MDLQKEWGNVTVTGRGSVYTADPARGILGYAFYYKTKDGVKKRKVITGRSEDELRDKAEKFLDSVNGECGGAVCTADGARDKNICSITFAEAGEEWFASYSIEGEDGKRKSYASIESRECSLRAVNKIIGGMPVAEIGSTTAEDLIRRCSRKENGEYNSRSHVDKIQQVFRMVMEHAKKSGYCTSVPDKVKLSSKLTTVDKDARFLDEEQTALVYKAVGGSMRYRTVVCLLLSTGLRQEEAFALNVKDFRVMKDGNVEVVINKTVVETEGHVYKIVNETKTERSRRSVFIPEGVYQMVMEYYNSVTGSETPGQKMKRKENGMEGYIFLNKDMKPLNKRTFQRNFKDYIKRNSKDSIDFNATLHMFRHTFASIQADGMGLDKVAMLLGDSIITTMDMYQSLTNKTKSAVCENSTKFLEDITGKRK